MQFKIISTAATEPFTELALSITKSKTSISNLRGLIQQLQPENQTKAVKPL